jgi:outer membrane protein TolC
MTKRAFWMGVLVCFVGNTLVRAQAPAGTRIDLQISPLNGELSLTLRDAIDLALARNPNLAIEKIRLEQAREKINEQKGNYDSLINFRTLAGRHDNVVASRFYPTGLYIDSEQAQSVGYESKNQMGGRINVALDYRRLVSTSNTQTLSPQYSATLNVTLTQSLLRDFGREIGTTQIRVAEKEKEIAEQNIYHRVSQLIQQVEEAYWSLAFLRQNLEARKRSLKFARGLLEQNEALLSAGRVAPVSVLEARSGVAAHEEEELNAESQMKKFEDRLKVLLRIDLASASITPVNISEPQTVAFDPGRSVAAALRRRAEIQALQREVEQREIERKFAANQKKPRLDVTLQYGVAGLAGRPNPTCLDPTSPVCEPVGSNVNGTVFADEKTPKDAFASMLWRKPFDAWSVDVKFEMPLGNNAAKSRLAEADLQLLESNTRLRAARDQVESEIRDAMRETLAAQKRIDAARENVVFVEDQLEGTRRKFEAGLSSSYDVLQVLEEVDKARTIEYKAVMDFNIGQSKVRLAEASTLEKYNIAINLGAPSISTTGTIARKQPGDGNLQGATP